MNIAICQLNFTLGDFEGNYQKIISASKQHATSADLIVFSELALSGYYPKDLIERSGFVTTQLQYLHQLQEATKHLEIGIVLGCILPCPNHQKPFYNSLVLIHQGSIIYQYHKMKLPVYNIFDEARHFTPGEKVGIFTFKQQRIGFLICEDGWTIHPDTLHNADPVALLQKEQPDLIISINGSPSNIGKQQERIAQFTRAAKQTGAPILFCNQIGGHDDLVFDGTSFCLQVDGSILGQLAHFEQDSGVLAVKNKTVSIVQGFQPYIALSDAALFYRQTILGLRDYMQKCQFDGVVIGLSGGIDSALTCALAALALGNARVTALAMPSRYSSTHSLTDAQALCDRLKIKLTHFPIEDEFTLAVQQFTKIFAEPPKSLTEQNIQARIRGRILMEFSNQYGHLVLSTGNKSELSMGYTTLYGDMTGGLNLIGDLYKTDVYQLAEYINQLHDNMIPAHILTKAPSAELAPNQKDTDNLPPYPLLDPVLKLYIEGDLLSDAEKQQYIKQSHTLPPEKIAAIYKQVDQAEYKRRQAPPIIRIQRRAFGIGRQFPIAAHYAVYPADPHPNPS